MHFFIFKNRNLGIYLILPCLITVLIFAPAVLIPNAQAANSDLSVSFAEAGDQSFPETDAGETDTVADLNFDSCSGSSYTAYTNGTAISARNIKTGNSVSIGTGAGTLNCANANDYGGAGGTGRYVAPPNSNGNWTLTFTNEQKYLGFWWSAGNDGNLVEMLDSSDTVLASFDSADLNDELFGSGNSVCSNNTQYCGNPNPPSGRVTNEPFAFIHMRYEEGDGSGFQKVRFSGPGFEFDNLTFSETLPGTGGSETFVGSNDISVNLPSILLVDPRSELVEIPNLALSDSNDAHFCIRQVQNSAGDNLSGSASISIQRAISTANVTETVTSNLWRYSGTRANVQTQIESLNIVSSSSGAEVVETGSLWVEFHLSSDTNLAGCTDSQPEMIVELRSLEISKNVTRNLLKWQGSA